MKAVAISLSALGDTGPLWRDWLEDAHRRFRVDVDALDQELPNWRELLERFAEERAPVYFRRDADVSTTLRRLRASGTRIGVFSDAPAELARIGVREGPRLPVRHRLGPRIRHKHQWNARRSRMAHPHMRAWTLYSRVGSQ